MGDDLGHAQPVGAAIVRKAGDAVLLGLFNFSQADQTAYLDSIEGVALPGSETLKPYEARIIHC